MDMSADNMDTVHLTRIHRCPSYQHVIGPRLHAW